MDLHERLAALISALGETPVTFSEKLGIQRSSVSHLLSARNKPSVDFLEKLLAVYPSINLSWLIAGLGKMWVHADAPEPHLPNEGKTTADILEPFPAPETIQSVGKERVGSRNPSQVLLLYPDGTFEVFHP